MRAVNIDGFFHLAKATLPDLQRSGGTLCLCSCWMLLAKCTPFGSTVIHVDLDKAEPGDPGGVRFKSEVAVVDQGPG